MFPPTLLESLAVVLKPPGSLAPAPRMVSIKSMFFVLWNSNLFVDGFDYVSLREGHTDILLPRGLDVLNIYIL